MKKLIPFLLSYVFLIMITSVSAFQKPDCTIESYNGINPPDIGFKPSIRDTSVVGRGIPLLPVPSDNDPNFNPAYFTLIPRTSLLGIIGRADSKYGEWLYVQLTIPDQIVQYGFVRKEMTTFSGDITSLEVIPVEECSTPVVSEINIPTSIAPPALSTVEIDGITFSLPDNWISHDFSTGALPQNGDLRTVLQTIPVVGDIAPEHVFVAAAPNQDKVDEFGIFYIGVYPEALLEVNQTDDISLTEVATILEQGLDSLVPSGIWQDQTELTDRKVIYINDYPFAYAHFIFTDVLTPEEIEKVQIDPSQNVLDAYYLITYKDSKWYMIFVTGLRASRNIQRTVINSVFIP